jgi:cytochrome c-type biogenesis protein CcmH/NrfG
VRQRVVAARHASAELDTDRALALLRDALSIDGCDATAWRLLGRLEFERGRAARAAPALAVALSLTAGEPATMVDLADALAVLNTASATGAASLATVLEALESHGNTRAVVDDARQKLEGRATARGLAIALYESFLERTSAEDPRLEAARRRAGEQVGSMRRGGAAPARAISTKPPTKSAKSKPSSAKAAKSTKATSKAKKTGSAKAN